MYWHKDPTVLAPAVEAPHMVEQRFQELGECSYMGLLEVEAVVDWKIQVQERLNQVYTALSSQAGVSVEAGEVPGRSSSEEVHLQLAEKHPLALKW